MSLALMSLWDAPIVLWTLPNLLVLPNMPHLTFIFPATVLESAIFPRRLGLFHWRMGFWNQGLGTGNDGCYQGDIASRTAQPAEPASICTHTNPDIHTYLQWFLCLSICKCILNETWIHADVSNPIPQGYFSLLVLFTCSFLAPTISHPLNSLFNPSIHIKQFQNS